jgi:hypothetical protein
MRGLWIGLLLASLVGDSACAWGQESPPALIITGVRVGFAGRYKVGLWAPVEVIVRSGKKPLAGTLTVTVPDDEGGPSRVTARQEKIRLEPLQETTVRLAARFGRVQSTLLAEFRDEQGIVERREFTTGKAIDADHYLPAIGANQELLLAIGGSDALGLDEAVFGREYSAEGKAVVERLERIDQLPTSGVAMEGVRAIALSTSRPEIYEKLSADDSHMAALDQWIQRGGMLVLCAGVEAERVLKAGSTLGRFLPGRIDRMVSLHQTAPLETYSQVANLPLVLEHELQVPRLAGLTGVVEAREGDLPLVVRCARGFGQIVVLAADLDQPPLSRWKGRGGLVARLLDLAGAPKDDLKTQAMMHYGIDDLGGQLRKALDRFPGVSVVSFWLVALLIGGYALLIGPADYFFLHKIVRRTILTWVTFPVIIVAVSAAAYGLVYQFKGARTRAHQADLIDVDAAGGTIRATTWASVFHPRTEALDLSARAKVPGDKGERRVAARMAWFGLPGSALGGMSPRTINLSPWTEPYDFSPPLDRIQGLPIQAWSTRGVTANWQIEAPCPVRAELTDEGQSLAGELTNGLAFPLSQCLLAYGYWAHDLGTIAPGQTVRLDASTKRGELRTFLTGRKLVFDKKQDKYFQDTTPYDRSSVDIAKILRTMMFFDAAGGTTYTGLLNGYQHFIDMSSMLKADRAILVAVGDVSSSDSGRPGTELLRDGQPLAGKDDPRVTVLRVVFPLKKIEGTKSL